MVKGKGKTCDICVFEKTIKNFNVANVDNFILVETKCYFFETEY